LFDVGHARDVIQLYAAALQYVEVAFVDDVGGRLDERRRDDVSNLPFGAGPVETVLGGRLLCLGRQLGRPGC
jgi:hypothetical protein